MSKAIGKGRQKDSQAGFGRQDFAPASVFGRNNLLSGGTDEIIERSDLPYGQFLDPNNSGEEIYGIEFGDETVSTGSFVLVNEQSGVSSRSSSPASNVDLTSGFNHSQEQIDKYVKMYHRTLSSNSSASEDEENPARKGKDLQYAEIFKSLPNNSSSSPKSSSSSGQPLLHTRDVTPQVQGTSFGIFDSRVHKDDDLNDRGHLRRNNNVKETFGPIRGGVSSNASSLDGSSPSPIVSNYSQSTDSFPRGNTNILTPETPFMSKSQIREQSFGKQLRNLSPSLPRLEKVREEVVEAGPSRIRDDFYQPETIHDRNSQFSVMSSDTDSLSLAPGQLWSSITVGSTQSIEVGYWKVKPIDSQLNISIEKANEVSH